MAAPSTYTLSSLVTAPFFSSFFSSPTFSSSSSSSSKPAHKPSPIHGGSLHLRLFLPATHPSLFPSSHPLLPIPFFSLSSSSSKLIYKPFYSIAVLSIFGPSLPVITPSLFSIFSSSPPPPIPPFSSFSSSSSNLINEVFNTTLPLHADFYDPALPFQGDSIHLRPFLMSGPSFLLLPFLLTPISSSSPTPLLLFILL